jgi:hypothetical protein
MLYHANRDGSDPPTYRAVAVTACLLASLTGLGAGEDAAAAFTKALQGDDAQEKRGAMQAATSGSDEDAIPLLILAVADRQTHDLAVQALRARTGLKPVRFNRGSGYPGYPFSDDPAAWQAWFAKWSENQARQRAIADALKRLGGKPAAPGPLAPAEPAGDVATQEAPDRRIPVGDLGRLDRIIYTSGRTLIAFKRSIRLDGDGKLVSIRIVHRDGSGEETIDGRLIARIDDDFDAGLSP